MSKGSTPRRNRDDNAYRENHEAIFGSRDDKDRYKPYKPKLTKKGDDGLMIPDEEINERYRDMETDKGV